MVQCLMERETGRGHRRNLYSDTHGGSLVKEIEPLTVVIRLYTAFCAGEDFCFVASSEIVMYVIFPSTT